MATWILARRPCTCSPRELDYPEHPHTSHYFIVCEPPDPWVPRRGLLPDEEEVLRVEADTELDAYRSIQGRAITVGAWEDFDWRVSFDWRVEEMEKKAGSLHPKP